MTSDENIQSSRDVLERDFHGEFYFYVVVCVPLDLLENPLLQRFRTIFNLLEYLIYICISFDIFCTYWFYNLNTCLCGHSTYFR